MVLRGFLKFFFGALAVLLIVLLVVIVGGFLAARNIDPNIFKVELERYLTQQTGMRVELGNIELQWGAPLSIKLDGLKFYNPGNLEKLLQSDSVRIEVDASSIWQKKVWMPRVTILNPEVFIKKRANGFWNWQIVAEPVETLATEQTSVPAEPTGAPAGFDASPEVAETPAPVKETGVSGKAPVRPLFVFGLGKIEIRDGTIQYADETIKPAYTFQVVKCEVEILPRPGFSVFRGVLRGVIWHAIERKIELRGDLDLGASVLDFQISYDEDRVGLKGVLKLVNTVPHFSGSFFARDLDLETLVPEVYKKGEYISGILDSDVKLSFEGGNPDLIFRSLNGEGTATIKNGALKNRNVIREVFQQMSPVIAVASSLGGEMPPQIAEMVKGEDTDFERATMTFTASGGKVTYQGFELMNTHYQLSGKGVYGLINEQIDLNAALRLSPSISGYFTGKIHELQSLCDRDQCLVIPFQYSGPVSKASVKPDLSYIGNQLLQSEAQKFIDKGVHKISKFLEKKTGV